MYTPNPQMMQMQAMGNPAAMGMMAGMNPNMMGIGAGLGNNPSFFYFTGNSLSLQSRLDAMSDQDASKIIDATIVVTGRQVQAMNTCGLICTAVWGGFIILPLFFMCCDWWKQCVYPAFDIDIQVYNALRKLFRSPNLRNISLTVVDSTFNYSKTSILYQMISQSRINGFTFINKAGNWNFLGNEYSEFSKNMKPIKNLPNIMSDIRWGTEIVL